MKISTKLRGSAVLIVGIVVIFVGAVSYFSIKAAQAGERNEIAQKILENAVQSAALRVEYGLTGEERPKVQWYALHDAFNKILDQVRTLFTEPADQIFYTAILEGQGKRKTIFDALVVAKEQSHNSELAALLNSQLAVTAQERVGIATQLAKVNSEEHSAFHQKLTYTIGFLGLLVIFLTLISYFVSRRISSSLLVLQQEFTKIASLDFSSTTTGSSDEIGQLARAFNMMVAKLNESYAGLEQKVRVRTQDLENAKIAARNVLEDLQVERDKLAEAKAKDEALLGSIGDGIIATDSNRRIIIMNKAAEKLLGWNTKEAIGKLYDEVVTLENEKGTFVPPEERPLNKAFAHSTTTTAAAVTLYLLSKNKIKFPVAITVSPIIFGNKIIGAIEVFRDITKEKEIDHAKSEFVSLASHQLRTPMTTISWVAEMLGKKEHLTSKGKRYLSDIITSAKHLSGLVDLLLNVSRIDEGRVMVASKPTELVAFINGYLNESEPLAIAKNLKLIFDKHPESLTALTDPTVFRNIIQAIISNALEYTPNNGRVEISLAENKKSRTFSFIVSDTGIGIPKAEQARIFTKFMRATNAKLKKADGTGLGMYIAEQGTGLLGGKIRFESEENKGTTFFVELPMESKASEKKKGVVGKTMT